MKQSGYNLIYREHNTFKWLTSPSKRQTSL